MPRGRPRKIRAGESPGEAATAKMIESLRAAIDDAEDLRRTALAEGAAGLPTAARALDMRTKAESNLARLELIAAAQGLALADKLQLDAILAGGEGSWGALANIRKLQAAHEEEIARAHAAAAEAEMADATPEELAQVMIAALAEAPIDIVRQVADATAARLTPRLVGDD